MRGDHPGDGTGEYREIRRSIASVRRELQPYTDRELVRLIMWRIADPSVTRRHDAALLDIDERAAREVLRERHSFS